MWWFAGFAFTYSINSLWCNWEGMCCTCKHTERKHRTYITDLRVWVDRINKRNCLRPCGNQWTDNGFGNDEVTAMSLALKENTTLTELTLRCEKQDKNKQTNKKSNCEQQVMQLELREQKQWVKCWKKIRPWQHWIWVVMERKKGKRRHKSDFSWITGNKLRMEGVNPLLEALRANTTLKKLHLYGKENKEDRWR